MNCANYHTAPHLDGFSSPQEENPGHLQLGDKTDKYYQSMHQPHQMPVVMASNDDNKYRQLPCRTFIAVGTCPFRDRCVYLHDPRLLCKDAKTKTRKKNRDDTVTDSLFWPVMHRLDVRQRLEPTGAPPFNFQHQQPHVIQPYHVPIPFAGLAPGQPVPAAVVATHTGSNRGGTGFGAFHDRCLYSLWMHFAHYCMGLLGPEGSSNTPTPSDNSPLNKFLGSRRLPFFVELAAGGSAGRATEHVQNSISVDSTCSDDEDTDLQQNPLPQLGDISGDLNSSSSSSPTSVLDGVQFLETGLNCLAKGHGTVKETCPAPPGLQLNGLSSVLVSQDVRSQFSETVLCSPANSPCRAPQHHRGVSLRQQPQPFHESKQYHNQYEHNPYF